VFEIHHKASGCSARAGILKLPHGEVQTPAFMPVGTQAAVKTTGAEDLERIGFQMILSNTYHLILRPGIETISKIGGLHKFMGWSRPILTDSGGYQVMSLALARKILPDKVRFKSHIDGTVLELSPEKAVEAQRALGVDISMALDVCPALPCTQNEMLEAMELTHAWAERSLAAKHSDQILFGIVQGGTSEELREQSIGFISHLPFDGFAIGGVSVGEPKESQHPVVEFCAPKLPENQPRYLMGVGTPKDIVHAVKHGCDLFDCVLPTRMARHNCVYTLNGVVNILNEKWKTHDGPFDERSVFDVTSRYTAAYIRHLFKSGEPLGPRLATIHNLAFYHRLMREIRQAIVDDSWPALEERYANA